MDTRYTLPLADPGATLETVGGKGASLAKMAASGLPVPQGYHVTTHAYRQFVNENDLQARIMEALEPVDIFRPETLEVASRMITDIFLEAPTPAEVAEAVLYGYARLPGASPVVAVRSSATAEDLLEASFAGQQETYLNICGARAVLEATRNCWASLWTGRAIGYRARQGIAPESVALAVVVQLMVPAEAAGILFTANPINGRREQMVINASWGLGEAIVTGLVTPDTITVDKTSGSVLSRVTAEKLVQTVLVEGGTQESSLPVKLRHSPVLNDGQAAELVALGKRIEALYDLPMDIEWTLTDGKFNVVQARPITALPDPEAPVPTEWKLPKGSLVAMRNNIVELMADPLTPLFRTLGLSAVNVSMNRLLFEFFERTDIMPAEPIIAVNEYAYYNGPNKLGPMVKIILDAGGIMKRMFRGAVERWTETGRPRYIATVENWQNKDWRQLSATEILCAARQLAEAAIEAYGALVSGVIPAAWISEGLFTLVYKLVKRRDDPSAATFLMGFDSLPIRAEKSLFDLAQWAQNDSELAAYLKEAPTQSLVAQFGQGQTPSAVEGSIWNEWKNRFQAHLQSYGHLIYNLDFSNSVPADDPAPLLETIKMYLSDQGSNPHQRQQETARRREQASEAKLKSLKGLRLKIFQKNLERAQRYAPLREDGLADVGLSYPLLRQMLFELGRRLVITGTIEKPEDIFWIEQDEVESIASRLDRGQATESMSARVLPRKAIWRAAQRVTPPRMLPQIKIFGIDLSLGKIKGGKSGKAKTLKGVAASPGRVTAPACVMHGPEDFGLMKTGDVLVAPITTPAWTPLFARAAAVVTDVGGPLSHGSIVAREYGIPAVLGTGTATKCISSGQVVSVDGSEGAVSFGT